MDYNAGKNKKVFGSLKGVAVGFAFAVFMIAAGIHPLNYTLIICGSVFGIWTIFLLYFLFHPFFSYNDQCLIRADLLKGWGGTEKVEWSDVYSIHTTTFIPESLITLKNGNMIPVNYLITPNHLKVLAEVVELVRKKNPDAKVSQETFKSLEKRHQQKQIYLFVTLILLFIVMMMLARFHWFDVR